MLPPTAMTVRPTVLGLAWFAACASSTGTPSEAPRTEAPESDSESPMRPKPTPPREVQETQFGVTVADPYRWLEDVEDPEVKTWMTARNDYARAVLEDLPGREEVSERLEELLYVDSRTVPVRRGGRLFFWSKPADREKAIFFVQPHDDVEPVELLNPNEMSEDGTLSISTAIPSPNGELVAYLEQPNNMDESTLRVLRVEDGSTLEGDVIGGLRYTRPAWTPDGDGFFYTWLPSDPEIPTNERMGHAEIRYHALGTVPAEDPTIRGETGNPEKWMGVHVSEDGRFLFLTISHGWAEEDLYVRRLGVDGAEWRPLSVGAEALYRADAWDGTIFLSTNLEHPNWEVYVIDPDRMAREHWERIVEPSDSTVIDGMALVGGYLGLQLLENASSRLEIRSLEGKRLHDVELPGIGTASSFEGKADQGRAYYSFSSFARPPEVYEVEIATGKTRRLHRTDAPVDPDEFVVEQRFYRSRDGTKVSIFLVHRPGVKMDATNPTLLYGYGGFNISLTPQFSPLAVTWVERGGLYAVPNLRGGGEYGESWHRAGMLENKQNVFDDFIAASEWLIDEGYTSTERLAIRGRSNGGLLVGAAMTQRPDLYGAVICGVPLLDMLRYHLYGIGKAWVPEYGSPEDESQFKVLHAYSPYHHVNGSTDYPPLLMLSADSDDRVDPMHARKFVAAVEAVSDDGDPVLLRIEQNSGHGGGDLRRQQVSQLADEIAFLEAQIGGGAAASSL